MHLERLTTQSITEVECIDKGGGEGCTFLLKKSLATLLSSWTTGVSMYSLTGNPSVRWTLAGAGRRNATKGPAAWIAMKPMKTCDEVGIVLTS